MEVCKHSNIIFNVASHLLVEEHGVPDHVVHDVRELLPEWLDRNTLKPANDVARAVDMAVPGPFDLGQAGDVIPDVFMKSALKIYGLQHTTNNMNEDIHKNLVYWPTFWQQLKNFEGLLHSRERRIRFLNMCVYGSSMECHAYKIKKWSHTLYEKRWKCVLAFLKHLVPILHVFRVCWDEGKYAEGNDIVQASAGNAEGARDGDANPEGEFDPKALTNSIRSNFFNRYVSFALVIDDIPEKKIAAWGEGCLCHEPLFLGSAKGDH